MGMTKGWKQYTWARVQALEDDPTGVFKGITEQFLQGIEDAKAKIRVDQELQTDRDQTAAQTLRRVETSGGSEMDSGTTSKVIGQ